MKQDWIGFFETMAQVSVTLFSLMFVAMQVNHKDWRVTQLRAIAAITALVELFIPMLISLIYLMPSHNWKIAASVGGVLGFVAIGSHWLIYRRLDVEPGDFDKRQFRWIPISFLAYSLLIASTIGQSLYLVAGTCVWLMFSGAFESWYLLDPEGLSGPDVEGSQIHD